MYVSYLVHELNSERERQTLYRHKLGRVLILNGIQKKKTQV